MDRRTWVVCAALLGVGCAPGNTGLVITGVLAPSEQCEFESSSTILTSGTLDVAGDLVRYRVGLGLANQLISLGETGENGPPMADPNHISVRELEVELRDIEGSAIGGLPVNPYVVPATGFVPSMTEGVSGAEVIPPQVGAGLAAFADQTIVVVMRAVGVTAGDAVVVSPEFHFPINLCANCLFACQREEGEAVCEPACNPGQDRVHITPAQCGVADSVCVAGGG